MPILHIDPVVVLRDAVRQLDEHKSELWRSIDYRDAESFSEGTARFRVYSDLIDELRELTLRVEACLSDAPAPPTAPTSGPPPAPPPQPLPHERRSGRRTKRSMDAGLAHTLDESFTFKQPVAFEIDGVRYDGVGTWRRLYELTCRHLHARDPERFAGLPTNPRFITKRDRRDFSADPHALRVPSEILPGLFAEVNLSANDLRNRTKKLLHTFGLPSRSLVVYLGADRSA